MWRKNTSLNYAFAVLFVYAPPFRKMRMNISNATNAGSSPWFLLESLENSLPFFKRLSDAWLQDNVDLKQPGSSYPARILVWLVHNYNTVSAQLALQAAACVSFTVAFTS